jgi:mannose-6-phosphate isomerase-like protein (cupin superfamily)
MKTSAFILLTVMFGISSTAPLTANAQNASVKVYTQVQLLELGHQLRNKEDRSKGLASQAIESSGTSRTLLATRDKDGQAEMHEKVSDLYMVVEGEATLLFGGTMVNPKTLPNGESLGDSVRDGQQVKLAKGDVVQIPPNIPHQLLVASGKSFTYFVLKFSEHP